MRKRIKWPNKVPVLTGKHFCIGHMDGDEYYGGDGTHCLLGWAAAVFPAVCDKWGSVREDHPVVRALADEVKSNRPTAIGRVLEFNDEIAGEKGRPRLARVWNRTMQRLGYTEPAGTYKGPK